MRFESIRFPITRLPLLLVAVCLCCGCQEAVDNESAQMVAETNEPTEEVPAAEEVTPTEQSIEQLIAEAVDGSEFTKLAEPTDPVYLKGSEEPYTGSWKVYYDDSGQIHVLLQLKEGKRHGWQIRWYESGQMQSKIHFKDGLSDGPFTYWYENGQKKWTGMHKRGEYFGSSMQKWYENGQVEMKAFPLSGAELHAMVIEWHENGQKRFEATYKGEKLVGKETRWDEDGKEIRWGENGKSTTVSTQAEEQELNRRSPGEQELPSEPDAPPEVTCPKQTQVGELVVIRMQSKKRPNTKLQYELRVQKQGGRRWTLRVGKPVNAGETQMYRNNFSGWGTGIFTVQARSSNGTAWSRWSEPQTIDCIESPGNVDEGRDEADSTDHLRELIEEGLAEAMDSSKFQVRDSQYYLTATNTLHTGWIKYVSSSGEVHGLQHVTNGKLDGPFVTWHKNGQKAGVVVYRDGKQQGRGTSWYESGRKWSEESWKDGTLDGTQTKWYENGKKKSEFSYRDGKLHGRETRWYENGQKEMEGVYENGTLIGDEQYWDEDGSPL